MLNENVMFHIFSSLLVICALMVIISEHPVFSLLFLVSSFVFASFLLFMLECEFLALLFSILYVGAIVILFLFSIMMLESKQLKNQVIFNSLPENLFLFTRMKFLTGYKNRTFENNYFCYVAKRRYSSGNMFIVNVVPRVLLLGVSLAIVACLFVYDVNSDVNHNQTRDYVFAINQLTTLHNLALSNIEGLDVININLPDTQALTAFKLSLHYNMDINDAKLIIWQSMNNGSYQSVERLVSDDFLSKISRPSEPLFRQNQYSNTVQEASPMYDIPQ